VSTPASHDRVRQARLAQHLSQEKLAALVGCTQSAISHFESGQEHVLSVDTLALVEKALGLSSVATPAPLPGLETPGHETMAFCPNHDCPGALPTVIRERIAFRPAFYLVPHGVAAAYCKMCGALLAHGCPNCCTPLVEAASFCMGCGTPLVGGAATLQPADPEGYAERASQRQARYLAARIPLEKVPRAHLPNTGQGVSPSV
jgi:transcriptional regulator with XRE-family HTH domain